MKTQCLILAVCLMAGVCTTDVLAHQDDATSQNKPKGEKLGRVLFKTSCTPEAQKAFERALGMLHSFFFPETVTAFTKVTEIDPSCAIAYWGLAVSTRPNPLVGPWDAATLKRGLDAVDKGKAIGAKTQRERDWLAAIEEVYKDYDKVDQDTRSLNYEKALERLTRKYPHDVEAKVFYALALNETALHSDKTYAKQLKAVKILTPIDAKYPDHPGVTHYLIHSLDYPPLAKRGVPVANKYAKVAPSAPHAQHMPSHIYSMVGMWEQSVQSNQHAMQVGRELAAKSYPGMTYASMPHWWDFTEYALLQMGQDQQAKQVRDEAVAAPKTNLDNLGINTGLAAIPARYALERSAWKEAAALQPRGSSYPQAEAITHFARALGAVRSGDFGAAQQDIDTMKELRASLEKANQSYWAEQVEVQILAAQGWLAQGQGNKEEAMKFMRAAADIEDGSEKHIAMENRLYPMRELLADMLLGYGQGAAALKEYEASMQVAPNRLRGFYGAAKAAEAVGDKKKAVTYMRSLAQLTRNADSDRPEIREAKQQRLASR
jgi:tetratricopeptide (TPR) repeat protein